MSSKTYSVPNISCRHCVATIERELGAVPGVESVRGDLAAKKVTIGYGADSVLPRVEEVLQEIGYPPAK
jgi:copper chaperone